MLEFLVAPVYREDLPVFVSLCANCVRSFFPFGGDGAESLGEGEPFVVFVKSRADEGEAVGISEFVFDDFFEVPMGFLRELFGVELGDVPLRFLQFFGTLWGGIVCLKIRFDGILQARGEFVKAAGVGYAFKGIFDLVGFEVDDDKGMALAVHLKILEGDGFPEKRGA